MKIDIRPAHATDFPEVHKLILEFASFQQTPDKVSITPEQMQADQDVFKCIVAANGAEIVGFATYFFAYYSWSGKGIYLDDLYVQPGLRGQGIGTALFDRVMEIGKGHDCKKMKWQVSKWNTNAQEFYKLKGAEIDGTEINCDLKLN